MPKKKILMITSRSDLGGGPKHLYLLTKELKKDSNFSIYIASPKDEPFYSKFLETCEEHVEIGSRNFSPVTFLKLLIFCKKNEIEIIHSHGRGAGLYSRLLGLWGMRIIHTFHGAHNESSILGKVKLFIDIALRGLTEKFICVSPSEKNKALNLKTASIEKTIVIPNGIDPSEFEKVEPIELGPNNPSIQKWGTLTRLSHEKGNDIFLKSIKDSPLSKDIHFYIAGEGPEEKRYKKYITDNSLKNVHLLGRVDNPIGFLKSLDGFFSFSRGEGLPLSVLEASFCELPIILSNVSGHESLSEIATLFDLSSPEQFHHLILKNEQPNEPLPEKYKIKNMVDKTRKQYDTTRNS